MSLADARDRDSALTDFQQNLVVVAGAGTGKTSLLVGRIAFALVRMLYDPGQILALTFTDNAAAEMRERLVRLLRAAIPWLDGGEVQDASDQHTLEALGFGPEDRARILEVLEQADSLPLSTFHSFCGRLLGQHARLLNLPPELNTGDQEGSRSRYDAAFLEYLAEQPASAIPEALRRFEPKALHDFGWELRSLPIDSIARCTEVPKPSAETLADLEEALDEVRTHRGHPELNDEYKDLLEAIDLGIAALLAGDFQAVPSDLPKKITRNPWRTKKDLETRARIRELVTDLLPILQPYAAADPQGIQAAIEFVQPFLERFQTEALRRGELTFDDIILQTRSSLMTSPALRDKAGGNLKAVLVDEFQDTDPLLYDILFLLCSEPTQGTVDIPLDLELRDGTLFIVGDPKQSIYRFRSADLAAFNTASQRICGPDDSDNPRGKRLSLTTNFRCATPIVDFVNTTCTTLLKQDEPYQLEYEPILAHKPADSSTVEWLTVEGTEDADASGRRDLEGRAVVESIEHFHAQGVRYSEIAVLLRAATETNWLMRPLRERKIPYAMEGSRRFYKRHEVVIATAMLGALARPHDPVPVLGILRSAFSRATDREILEFVRAHGEHALDYRRAAAAPQVEGAVADTLRWLHALHCELRMLPVDQALERLFGLEAWTLTEGAGYEGAQRLANLERMRQRVLDASPLDLTAAADFAEARTTREVDDEESPLFDSDFDAVRVLTIHASKGLEYEAVIVPDLARQVRSAERDAQEPKVQRAFLKDGSELVGARLGGIRNTASWVLRAENTKHADAEASRLFYVAATRAKKHLRLLCSASTTRMSGSLQKRIEATAFPSTTVHDTLDPRPTHAAAADPAEEENSQSTTLRAWRAHEHLLESWSHPAVGTSEDSVPGSGAPEAALPATSNRSIDPTSGGVSKHNAADLGTAMHRYLAIVDVARDSIDEPLAAAILEGAEFGEPLREMAERFHGSEFARRMRDADAVHREIPIGFQDADGHPQSRVIDLLLIEDGGERVTVVDHKSDVVADGDGGPQNQHLRRAASYRSQLSRYAQGVMQALELGTLPECLIHFTRDSVLCPIEPVDSAATPPVSD